MNLSNVIEETLKKGGVTHSLNYGDMSGSRNYVVSIAGRTKKVHKDNLILNTHLKSFIMDNIDYLISDYVALGTWIYEDEIYFDVAQLFSKDEYDLEYIKELITSRAQISGWDLEFNQEIKP